MQYINQGVVASTVARLISLKTARNPKKNVPNASSLAKGIAVDAAKIATSTRIDLGI